MFCKSCHVGVLPLNMPTDRISAKEEHDQQPTTEDLPNVGLIPC